MDSETQNGPFSEADLRRVKSLTRSIQLNILGYILSALPLSALTAMHLDPVPGWGIIVWLILALSCCFVHIAYLKRLAGVSSTSAMRHNYYQITLWFLFITSVAFFLSEWRVVAALVSMIAYFRLAIFSNLRPVVVLVSINAVGYWSIAYLGIHGFGQPGDLRLETIFTVCLLTNGIVLALVAEAFSQQRAEVVNAKRNAEDAHRQADDAHRALKEANTAELRNIRERLGESQKLSALGQMVASVGHELANPLNVGQSSFEEIESASRQVRSCIDNMIDPNESPEAEEVLEYLHERFGRMREAVQHGQLAISRLTGLSSALRRHTRMDSTYAKNVSINEIVRESLVLVRGKTRMLKLSETLDELPSAEGNRSRIGQVITNLLSNAADAVLEKAEKSSATNPFIGHIRVTTQIETREGRTGICITVADNGNGVPTENRENIFDDFFTTKATKKGTGLGLSICRGIAQEHQAELTIDDDDVLGGARFDFWLPLEQRGSILPPPHSSQSL